MARTGQILENPRRRERVTVLASSADTGGKATVLAVTCEPTPAHPPLHIHPKGEERFDIDAGTLTYVSGPGGPKTASAGETVVVPPGVAHTWWNGGPSTLEMRGTFAPSGQFERFMETIYGLTRDGKVNAQGVPNIFQIAVIAHAHRDDWIPAAVPAVARLTVLPVVAAVGRLLGYRAWYPKYSGPDAEARGDAKRSTAV